MLHEKCFGVKFKRFMMAIIVREIPKCDVCGGEWLPDRQLPDGSTNPAFDDPRKCKRCGKCKTPRWNENERKRELRDQIRKEVHAAHQGSTRPKKCKHELVCCPACGTDG
jgi:hypothetical protein